MEERSLTKMENGDMKRNKKKLDERRDLASRKNGKYLFGINDEPFLSLRGFLLLVKKSVSGSLFNWKLLLCLANSYFFTLDLTL